MLVSTDEGVVYTLRYGGPVFAAGDELTDGAADDAEKKKDERRQEGRRARSPRARKRIAS